MMRSQEIFRSASVHITVLGVPGLDDPDVPKGTLMIATETAAETMDKRQPFNTFFLCPKCVVELYRYIERHKQQWPEL